jgi:hypothetical protein
MTSAVTQAADASLTRSELSTPGIRRRRCGRGFRYPGQSGRTKHDEEGAAMPRAQIKDEETYRALRREGNGEEKSARIANAAAASSREEVGARGGRSQRYEAWTKKELVERAREIGIKGRSSMSKPELISALRNH